MNPTDTPRTDRPLTDAQADAEARRIIADVYRPDDAAVATPTAFRDDTPLPTYGDMPPVAQPGRAPMSGKAVDDTARLIGASVLVSVTGGTVSLVLRASDQADPVVLGVGGASVAAVLLAAARLIGRAKTPATPPETTVHVHGPVSVDQRTTHTRTHGVWVRNNHTEKP
ncbi:hypothetical protein SRB5_51610 [Streptomyces sp. RB5]|uniref:Uncharacterized protein n=1 Tax=Streptomyces smaragdinus TaxID=2585196 RepID=A0A7K0CQF3_9ACTN|nr:hypothetical protein [Streptomyces smaragdinus]MQY14984.1 hypothetical protein [Streptomyces smaragdinus]